jgi:hypothetical protein
MNAQEGQALVRLLMHLSGAQVLSEATLSADVAYLTEAASTAVGVRVDVSRAAILRTLALVVAAGHEVPLATPMRSTFGEAS